MDGSVADRISGRSFTSRLPKLRRTAIQNGSESLQATVMEISNSVYHASAEGSAYLRGTKCALSILGYCRNMMAEPYEPYGPVESERIRAGLAKIGLMKPVLADQKRVL
jgi:hypothetical protein